MNFTDNPDGREVSAFGPCNRIGLYPTCLRNVTISGTLSVPHLSRILCRKLCRLVGSTKVSTKDATKVSTKVPKKDERLLCDQRKNSAIEREDVQFALRVLGKAGDVLGLFKEGSVVRKLAIFFAQAVD